MAGLRQPDQNGMDRTLARMPPGNQAYLAARGIHSVRQQRDLLCPRPSPAPFNAH
jgi:hypothetical protein